jgi:hypothetical protein
VIGRLLATLPNIKSYWLHTDAWFFSSALAVKMAAEGVIYTSSCSKARGRAMWSVLDKQLKRQRLNGGERMFAAGEGVVPGTNVKFNAIAADNGRKNGESRFLHYYSTGYDGNVCELANKFMVDDEYRRVKKEQPISAMKQAYDVYFAEDEADQAAAATEGKFRRMHWRVATIMGVLNVLVAQNARLLFCHVHPLENAMTVTTFVQRVAFALADKPVWATTEHALINVNTRSTCACCQWIVNKKKKLHHKPKKTKLRCMRCNVYICGQSFKNRKIFFEIEAEKNDCFCTKRNGIPYISFGISSMELAFSLCYRWHQYIIRTDFLSSFQKCDFQTF